MAVAGFASAMSRRAVVAVGLAAALSAASIASAQQAPAAPAAPAPPAAGAPQTPQADPFKFTTDAGGWLWQVKPEQAASFEGAWKEIRTKLLSAERADLKELGSSIRMYKIVGDPGPQGVSYLFVADPASKTLSYNPSPAILFESKLFDDAAGRRLYDALNAATNGINPLSLNIVPAQ
jgi:hypothetical protein